MSQRALTEYFLGSQQTHRGGADCSDALGIYREAMKGQRIMLEGTD